jgi:2OG-Fe(II) oxygenase superfamily
MDAAITQGLKVAGTRKSQSNSIRTHSYTTWLGNDKNDVEDNDLKYNPHRCYKGLVQGITGLCKSLFVHESLLLSKAENRHQQQQQFMFVAAEDMQIAKYDAGGSFHLHHDGFSRFLTVLTYLNGVGGTYFPLARTKQSGDSSSNHDDLRQPPKLCMNDDGSLSSKGYVVGTDGLLIVGKEGAAAYLDNENAVLLAENRSAIARIQAGDAVVFYNYNLSKKIDTIASNGIRDHGRDDREDDAGHNKEWRAVHAALPSPREKWIATNWFRSQELTGPYAHLYRERLLSDTDTDTGTDLLAIR